MFDPYNPIPTSVQPYGYGVNPYLRQNPSQTNLPSQPQITTNKIIVSGLEEVKMRMQPANSEIRGKEKLSNTIIIWQAAESNKNPLHNVKGFCYSLK